MSLFRAGSAPWLLKHELRLVGRGLRGSFWIMLAVVLVVWGVLHWSAWILLAKAGPTSLDSSLPLLLRMTGAAVLWMLMSVLVGQTLQQSVIALFERGDLDLLLASPIPPRHVFLMRGLSIALSAMVLPALLLLPFAHVGPFTGHPELLAAYPLLISLGLACAAFGILLTLALVRWLGARRARTVAQVLGALLGGMLFIGFQVVNFSGTETRTALLGWLMQQWAPGGMLAPASPFWWPLRALFGDPLLVTAIFVAALAAFLLVVRYTHKAFVGGNQQADSSPLPSAASTAAAAPHTFRRGWVGLLLRKEWRLILRDPNVISQTLLQLLYMCPMLLVGLRGQRAAILLIPSLVVIGAMLAGSLAWLTVSAEDAPDLIGSAPRSLNQIQNVKVLAAVLPVLLLVSPLLLYWLPSQPLQAGVLLLSLTGAACSAALAHVWQPRRGDRKDMRSRYKQNRLSNFLELFGVFGWAGMVVCILGGFWKWLPLPASLALLAPTVAWLIGRSTRREMRA